jgi:hypothetical protein
VYFRAVDAEAGSTDGLEVSSEGDVTKKSLTAKRRVKGSRSEASSCPSSGKPYLGFVPNFTLLDIINWLPHSTVGRKMKKTGGIRWAFHLAVIFGRRAQVLMPVNLLAQVVWGGDKWPANWRNELVFTMQSEVTLFESVEYLEATTKGDCCGPDCLMYASGEKHHHLLVTIRTLAGILSGNEDDEYGESEDDEIIDNTFLASLELCGSGEGAERRYDFRKPKPTKSNPKMSRRDKQEATLSPSIDENDDDVNDFQEKQLRVRWGKRVLSAYFPLLLFGSSPRMGLSAAKQLL